MAAASLHYHEGTSLARGPPELPGPSPQGCFPAGRGAGLSLPGGRTCHIPLLTLSWYLFHQLVREDAVGDCQKLTNIEIKHPLLAPRPLGPSPRR